MMSKLSAKFQETDDISPDLDEDIGDDIHSPSLIFQSNSPSILNLDDSSKPISAESEFMTPIYAVNKTTDDLLSPSKNFSRLKIDEEDSVSSTTKRSPSLANFGTTRNRVKSSYVNHQAGITAWQYAYDSAHKPYVLYRLDFRYDGTKLTTWKRYSNFIELHQQVILPPLSRNDSYSITSCAKHFQTSRRNFQKRKYWISWTIWTKSLSTNVLQNLIFIFEKEYFSTANVQNRIFGGNLLYQYVQFDLNGYLIELNMLS